MHTKICMILLSAVHNNPMKKTWVKQNELFRNFLKCGTVGWCLEILFTSVESVLTGDWRLMGRTSLLMFPIYGLGALLGPVGKLVDRWLDEGIWELKPSVPVQPRLWNFPLITDGEKKASWPETAPLRDLALRHGMIDMVLIFCAEYFFGFWMRRIGICPWDYSGRPTNINGLIRLDFAPLWFGTGLLFEGITGKILGRRPGGGERM